MLLAWMLTVGRSEKLSNSPIQIDPLPRRAGLDKGNRHGIGCPCFAASLPATSRRRMGCGPLGSESFMSPCGPHPGEKLAAKTLNPKPQGGSRFPSTRWRGHVIGFAVLLMALACTVPDPAPNSQPEPGLPLGRLLSDGGSVADVVDRVLPGVVKVISPPRGGTGFIISPTGLVVTNRHVVDGAKSVTILLLSGKRLRGRVTFTHRTA